jgi:hypothetical protein
MTTNHQFNFLNQEDISVEDFIQAMTIITKYHSVDLLINYVEPCSTVDHAYTLLLRSACPGLVNELVKEGFTLNFILNTGIHITKI